jgi:hypothetical protein
MSFVFYGFETWSFTLREEQRLRVFENRVLRKLFGSKRDEVTGEWRRVHKKSFMNVLLTIYYVGDQTTECEMRTACGTYGRQKRYVQGFVRET